jgi:hypothetical protein
MLRISGYVFPRWSATGLLLPDSVTGLAGWIAIPTPLPALEARPMPAEPATVEPKHPLHAMTTFELRDYRRQLESAIAHFDRQAPVPPARDRLQAKLDEVLAEQDQRARIASTR